jgi:gliding motility-associated lipoprotein GldB
MIKQAGKIFAGIGFLLVLLVAGCNENSSRPDVSGIDINPVKISRYERALFGINFADLPAGLDAIHQEYRFFLGDQYRDTLNLIRLNNFLRDPIIIGVYQQSEKVFPDLLPLENQLAQAFRYWKYYFPEAKQPKVYSFISGFYYESPIELYDSVLIISLDLFLGPDYEPYRAIGLPQYMIRRMGPEFLAPDCMKQIAISMLPESTSDRTLLDQMILHGKILYFLDQVLPEAPDSLKSGFTASEEKWSRENERMLWSLMIDNDLLYSTDPVMINKYIQDGPFTSGLPEESPAMLGRWLGWQIVRSYMKKNSGTTLKELFAMTDSQQILSDSRYKPAK